LPGPCGLCVPKATPVEIVNALNKEVNSGLADPRTEDGLTDRGAIPFVNSPGEFAKFIGDETAKWAKVIKFSASSPNDPVMSDIPYCPIIQVSCRRLGQSKEE
jgi:Tripartite tricarboxylate transporter family receptor